MAANTYFIVKLYRTRYTMIREFDVDLKRCTARVVTMRN